MFMSLNPMGPLKSSSNISVAFSRKPLPIPPLHDRNLNEFLPPLSLKEHFGSLLCQSTHCAFPSLRLKVFTLEEPSEMV